MHVLLDCLINPCVAGVPKALCFIVIPLFLQKLSMFLLKNYFPLLHTVFGEIFWCKSVAVRHAIHFLQFLLLKGTFRVVFCFGE